MGLARFRRELRLKQSRDEKTMSRGLDRPSFSFCPSGYDGKSGFNHHPFELGIDFVVAEEFLGDDFLLVKRMEVRSWPDSDFRDLAGKLGCVRGPVGQGASHGRNHNVLRSRIILRRICVFDTQHIARTLYQSVLKAPSSADEGPVAAARKLNAAQHSV